MSVSTSTRAIAVSCSGPYTAPVGFDGELSMMPRVRGVIARRNASGSSMKPDSSEHGTNFGSAPDSETIAAKLTHAGVGMITSSPSSNSAAITFASACLHPADAIISAGS